jgi:hypothetical protein
MSIEKLKKGKKLSQYVFLWQFANKIRITTVWYTITVELIHF